MKHQSSDTRAGSEDESSPLFGPDDARVKALWMFALGFIVPLVCSIILGLIGELTGYETAVVIGNLSGSAAMIGVFALAQEDGLLCAGASVAGFIAYWFVLLGYIM
ncbi:MAG: hypothetical protein AAGH15_10625 [Myxococcota bacterium]